MKEADTEKVLLKNYHGRQFLRMFPRPGCSNQACRYRQSRNNPSEN